MRERVSETLPVIEWSPEGLSVYEPAMRGPEPVSSAASLASRGISRAILALSRRSAFIRSVRVPNAGENEIRQVLAMQVDQLFPLPGSQLAFGFQLTNDVNAEGRLAVVAATPVANLREAHAQLNANGIDVVTAVPTALGSALLTRSINESSAAVLELGREGLSIDVVVDGELRASRVVPAPADAEDLEAEICRSFQMVGVPCGIAISAGGSELPAARKSQTHAIELLSTTPVQELGLTLLLPEIAEKRERRRVAARARLALLVAIVAGACATLAVAARLQALSDISKGERRWTSNLTQLNTLQTGISSRAGTAVQQSQALGLAFNPAQRPSEAVALAGNLAPKGIWLSGVTFERGKPMLLRGTAMRTEDVTTYLQSLTSQSRFRNVKLVFANNALIDTTPVVNFSLSVHVVGNLPIVEAKAAKN